MLSVRVAAAGAVVASVVCFAAPAGAACDFDRTPKKCDREIAAREQADAAPVAKRKSAKRVRVVSSRRAKHTRLVKRTRAPGFAVKREGGMQLASAGARMTTLVPESVLARRFRGFIDPKPLADNSFEVWRKPHFVTNDLDASAILPVEAAEAAPAPAEHPAAVAAETSPAPAPATTPTVITTAKQDRIAPRPPAQMELASAEARPVTLAPAPTVSPAPAPVLPSLVTAQASMTEAVPAPAPSSFSFHGLVLALCGALGAASALRFIVGA